MMSTVRHTSKDIKKISSKTDLHRLDTMDDTEIDFSDQSELTADMFKQAKRAAAGETNKIKITVRLDSDVVSWLKDQGGHYQRRMNNILRAVMQSSR